MKDLNFEIIAAAQDTGGEAAAGSWYDAAKATYTTLIDKQHAVSSAFQLTNVPMGVWIDEKGLVVRPPETAYTKNQTLKVGAKSIATEGEAYTAALRDWVEKGSASIYALSDDEYEKRVKPRPDNEMQAEASFKLGIHFHETAQPELAAKHFQRAQQLHPDNWNYHRQDWSFTPTEAGKKWLEKFNKQQDPYYPKLELQPK